MIQMKTCEVERSTWIFRAYIFWSNCDRDKSNVFREIFITTNPFTFFTIVSIKRILLESFLTEHLNYNTMTKDYFLVFKTLHWSDWSFTIDCATSSWRMMFIKIIHVLSKMCFLWPSRLLQTNNVWVMFLFSIFDKIGFWFLALFRT